MNETAGLRELARAVFLKAAWIQGKWTRQAIWAKAVADRDTFLAENGKLKKYIEEAMTPLYVIYEDPKDYPGKFVVRRWACRAAGAVPDQEPVAVVDTIEAAREALPKRLGLHPLRRDPRDDMVIKELWV